MAYHRRKTSALATQAIELGFAAPQVIAHRLARIAAAGSHPSVADWNEYWLMGAEKIAAFGESWSAMCMEAWRANLAFALSLGAHGWLRWPLTTRSSRARAQRHVERTALAALAKGIAPIHRRAVANARRLGRKG